MLQIYELISEIRHTYAAGRQILPYIDLVAVLPVLAAGFAVPQFLPQILKLRRTHDTAGLSTPWALLTGVNNTAWFGYFAASHYWFALIPSSSAALLGGSLGIMLMRRGPRLASRSRVLVGAWSLVLAVAGAIDRRLLGVLLTGAFLIQVLPAVTTAYRTHHPTGIARGTWRLILAEVSCWAVFGAANHDGPLIVLGTTGIVSALLMLHRAGPENTAALRARRHDVLGTDSVGGGSRRLESSRRACGPVETAMPMIRGYGSPRPRAVAHGPLDRALHAAGRQITDDE
jgi:PQ loop repeat